ncbi:IclR family transcriptional regulator [Advenella kashmirensis W13003]|uniref:IclR family transcriptional regulator n=1 Tax=Advenella kashmirensis W13003 TaxID=1424334 RepID=V8QW43_9BURK|nr:IclR family transcriptional regulator [Advenella kashmirensis]ETF04161.1 IclR family transcriptional regulator [Advenella kashmirensis W13003]
MDKTLLKGLKVLEIVTGSTERIRTIEELADKVGLTRSNTHRTLQTLIHAGFVARDDHDNYVGGIRLFELAANQLAQLDLRSAASSAMRALADSTGETIHLSVLDGFDVVYVDKIDSPRPIRAYSMIGGRAPAYAVATGKAILAHQTESFLQSHSAQLKKHTDATITDLEALQKALARTIKQGYAVNRGEWRDGVGGIAVPIFNGLGQIAGAVGISAPLDRLTPARVRLLVPEVIDCARTISRQLGYSDRPGNLID